VCRVPLRQRTITDSPSCVEAVEFLQLVIETDACITGYGRNGSSTPGLRAAQIAVIENCCESNADIWEKPIVVQDRTYPSPQEPDVACSCGAPWSTRRGLARFGAGARFRRARDRRPEIRRLLLPTGWHIYYSVDASRSRVPILAVWYARRGQTPPL